MSYRPTHREQDALWGLSHDAAGMPLQREPSVATRSGKLVNLLDPDPATIIDDDIAAHLARESRWSGATKQPYSVLHHSINVAGVVWGLTHDPLTARTALYHDATEAYMKDIPSPLKQLLPGYQFLEQRLCATIMKARGLTYPLPPVVHYADRVMAILEDQYLMGTSIELLDGRHGPGSQDIARDAVNAFNKCQMADLFSVDNEKAMIVVFLEMSDMWSMK